MCVMMDRTEIIDRPLISTVLPIVIPSARNMSFWVSVMAAIMETWDGLSA